MHKDKYVFAQLVDFLDNNKFRRLVEKYHGDFHIRHFTCWNHLLALMFGQLSGRESLRDLVVTLEAHRSKCYHLGLGRRPVAKATLADANQRRDYALFRRISQRLGCHVGREGFPLRLHRWQNERRTWRDINRVRESNADR